MLLALALRVLPWLKPNGFLGVLEYDDGVYYAASKALLHGVVPYRDFAIVHPPLTLLLLAPAAAFGAIAGDQYGMGLARICVEIVECVNVWLVFTLTHQSCRGTDHARRVASTLAAAFYAVAPGAVAAGHTVLLEPFTNLFALLSMRRLLGPQPTRRHTVAAGACVAAAIGVKAFAVVYALVASGWLLLCDRRRFAGFAAGTLSGLLLIFLPFTVIAGPGPLWRDLVLTQMTRPADGIPSIPGRVSSLLGLSGFSRVGTITALVAVFLLAAVMAWSAGSGPLTPAPAAWVWLAVAGASALAFLTSPSYFSHYASFFTAPAAVAVASLSSLCSAAGRHVKLPALAVALALIAAAAASSIAAASDWHGSPSFARVDAVVSPKACVYTDAISLAIAADRFHLPRNTCPEWIDGRGQNLVWSVGGRTVRGFYPRGFLLDARWQSQTLAQLRCAAYLLTRTDPIETPEWTARLRSYVRRHFRLVWHNPGQTAAELWARSSLAYDACTTPS